ncbi:hypothetical protein NKH16_26235 [Mesorhizobium sp. M1307]|uniref:hypothetical protein n=1 Tax=Mesorhizobium sp. M1307 TaxID=2957079 RepID=UPI00333BD088
MALHWFNPPVSDKTERPGIIRHVNNAETAGEELMKWTSVALDGTSWCAFASP